MTVGRLVVNPSVEAKDFGGITFETNNSEPKLSITMSSKQGGNNGGSGNNCECGYDGTNKRHEET